MLYSEDPKEHAEIQRWAFLSGYAARNDAEEAEAQELQKKYGEKTGWPLVERINTLNQETVIKLLEVQCRSADMWISQWEKYKDAASMRNVALAVGKIGGIYNVLLFMTLGKENIPEDIIALVQKYQAAWDKLTLD